jgi:hypothetical protein
VWTWRRPRTSPTTPSSHGTCNVIIGSYMDMYMFLYIYICVCVPIYI